MRTGLNCLLVVAGLALVGCNGGKNQTNIELINDMMDQINVKAQDWDADRPGMRANFLPPEGSIPRGYFPYRYANDPMAAEKNLKNPLAGDFSPQTIKLGKAKFDVYCVACHGASGLGDGLAAPKMMLKPPQLASDKVKAFADGRIFHIITDGQGLMSNYATQITDEKARWAIVNYVRTLQRTSNTK